MIAGAPCSPLLYSHAYFPRAAFDEVEQRAHWTLGRKGDSYRAPYSQSPTIWVRDGLTIRHAGQGLTLDFAANCVEWAKAPQGVSPLHLGLTGSRRSAC
jgi:hypothetical protein